MSNQLSPKYTPSYVQAGRYQKCLDTDVFKPAGDQKAKSYSIVIPTTKCNWKKLYLSHAWGITFKVNESQRNWDFLFKLVAESQRISKPVESGLLKNELEEKIDG